MFSKVLCAEQFTLAYVKEHLPEEKKLRFELMEQMYQRGKSAFQTALKALGYEVQEGEAGFEVVSAKYSEEQKQQALEENRILRTRIAQSGAERDDRIADAVLEQVNQLEQEYYENSRKLMREDQEYGFISSGHLSNLEQYEKLLSVKKLLEEKAESAEYAEHKELLGKLYEELENKERYLTADGVRRCAENRLEEQREKLKVLWERADAVEAGIRRLLKQEIPGRELTEKQSLLLESYMPAEQDVYQKRRLEAKQRAKAYAEKARAVALLGAYREGSLDQECFRQSLKGIGSIAAAYSRSGRWLREAIPGQEIKRFRSGKAFPTVQCCGMVPCFPGNE